MAFIWCAKGSQVEGHQAADQLAKATANHSTCADIPVSLGALHRLIKANEKARPNPADTDPRLLARLHHSYNPESTYKALSKLSRPDATFVAQIRAGHCPLNSYLHRFHITDDPLCSLCPQKEDVEHFLLTCKKFVGLRRRLMQAAAKLKIKRGRSALLADPRLFEALAKFGKGTFRFYRSRYPRNGPAPAPPPATASTTTPTIPIPN